MGLKPTISKGLGALTPEAWAKIVAATEWVLQNKESVAREAAERASANVPDVFVAKITGSAALATAGTPYFWKYSWSRQVLSGSQSSLTTAAPTGLALAGTNVNGQSNAAPSTWAVNLFEVGNTATARNGYTHDGSTGLITDAPNYKVDAVPTDAIVLMHAIRLDAGTAAGRIQYVFEYPNPITGGCETAFFDSTSFDAGTYSGPA